MKNILQDIYNELKEKSLKSLRATGTVANQSIAITQNLLTISFDRDRGMLPAGILGVATKGWVGVPDGIREGLITAIFVANHGNISKHELFDLEPDYIHIDKKNFLWFELNSRIVNIREAYFLDYNHTPPELQPIPNEKFDAVVENEVMELFKLHS